MLETSLSLLERLHHESDSASWEQLVNLYTPLLRSWMRRYEDLSDADGEDLVQNVLLAVSQELPKFRHNRQPGAFRKWLKIILIHRLREFWRARDKHPVAIGGSDFLRQLEQLEDDASGISEIWDREHDSHVTKHLLSLIEPHFAPHTWTAFRRHVLEEVPAQAVAADLEMPVGAVYGAKSRVLAALRNLAQGLLA